MSRKAGILLGQWFRENKLLRETVRWNPAGVKRSEHLQPATFSVKHTLSHDEHQFLWIFFRSQLRLSINPFDFDRSATVHPTAHSHNHCWSFLSQQWSQLALMPHTIATFIRLHYKSSHAFHTGQCTHTQCNSSKNNCMYTSTCKLRPFTFSVRLRASMQFSRYQDATAFLRYFITTFPWKW